MLKQHGQPVEIADGVFWLRIGSVSGNVYFISAGSAWALVDAGLANRGEQIRRAAETLFGVGTAPVAILLTHVHPDHCGSARELARLWSCPVYTHPDELSLAVDRRLATVVRFANPLDRWLILPLLRTIPRRRLEAMLEKDSLAGVAQSLPPDAAVPGLEGWTSISAPGHSPGHVVFFRAADRVLISGDAVVTVVLDSFWRSLPYALLPAKPRVSGPPWYTTWNQQKARTSIAALARLEPRVLASGHGVPLVGWSTAGLLRAYAERRALEVSVLPQGPRVQVRPRPTGRDLRQRRTMITGWTVESIPDLTSKVAIVTGANSGIGFEMARALAGKSATVILACRDQRKGAAALHTILRDQPGARALLSPLDLADLASVRSFVQRFAAGHDRLDILINNAGVMATPRGSTADGFELQFGTNHLGHFALTGLLLDTITRTPKARVVTISSMGHRFAQIDFANLNAERAYDPQRAYAQSKLANLLFTYELQRRFAAAGVSAIAAAAHPGWTATNLQVHWRMVRMLNPLLGQAPRMGALPALRAASSPDVVGGDYYGPGGWLEIKGAPVKVKSSRRSLDAAVATRLWAISEELTGVRYPWPNAGAIAKSI